MSSNEQTTEPSNESTHPVGHAVRDDVGYGDHPLGVRDPLPL
ncbi:hypothetical protein ACFXGG_18760 [Streptomyces nigra]